METMEQKKSEQLTLMMLKHTHTISQAEETPSGGRNKDISLSQIHGKPLKLNIHQNPGPQTSNNRVISVEAMSAIQDSFNLSFNTVKGVACALRASTKNREIFEINLEEKLVARNHLLDKYFDVTCLDFINVKASVETGAPGPVAFCKDLHGLIEHINEERQFGNFTQVTFDEAVDFCKNNNLELVTIENESENNNLYQQLDAMGIFNTALWTSGTRLAASEQWVWLSNMKTIDKTYWNFEPSYKQGTEYCLSVAPLIQDPTRFWINEDCSIIHYPICQIVSSK
ncbi:unnamed protein product [Psylliodes chrysocephalus]|uniref:C-type lectin domain-containing protein n=1 Tax=Psylliodes chrysocephalus TaxID=3402493 RepID=A0A9P0CRK1_9CUCU|nr:unnamed protein product [Psylliodes chrysocephala]